MKDVLHVAFDRTECFVQHLAGRPSSLQKKGVLVVQPKACMSSREYMTLALNSLG